MWKQRTCEITVKKKFNVKFAPGYKSHEQPNEEKRSETIIVWKIRYMFFVAWCKKKITMTLLFMLLHNVIMAKITLFLCFCWFGWLHYQSSYYIVCGYIVSKGAVFIANITETKFKMFTRWIKSDWCYRFTYRPFIHVFTSVMQISYFICLSVLYKFRIRSRMKEKIYTYDAVLCCWKLNGTVHVWECL